MYEGDDAVAFVISLNLHRRHLTESQRATVAAKLANITNGGDRRSDHSANLQSGAVSQSDAAQMLNVSTRSVAAVAKVLHEGAEELVQAVERGDATVSAAAAVRVIIAKDVAEVLGYSDAEAMTRKLDDDEKQNLQIVGFGPRGVSVINEAGLYAVVLTSQKPEAKPFKRWVTHEVLPRIRL